MALLDGKVVIISGVGVGLGTQLALAASGAGASVVLGARSEAYLEEVAGTIRASGGAVCWARCDITRDEDCAGLVRTAVDEFGGLDCLVNNAYKAGTMGITIEDGDLESWRETFDVNLFGSLRLCKAAIPALRQRGGGSIVFSNSQIVRRVFAGRGPYATSKAALLTAAQVLAREVGHDNIRVNSVVIGRMWGPPFEEAYRRRAAEHGVTLDEELAPVRQTLALPSIATDAEVSGAILFLASDLAIAMTGQSVDVNAGETFH